MYHFFEEKSKLIILFWVLVFSFMYLVSVDAKDRSLVIKGPKVGQICM